VLDYCREQEIEFTRSRPHRKNDQAWVEQKNGAIVRQLAGNARFAGVPAAKVLTRLYAAARLYTNFFGSSESRVLETMCKTALSPRRSCGTPVGSV
jgi:hypothetical protein